MKRVIVISGLPGSGKSTLARRLGAELRLPVIDKDDILEELFELKGWGGQDVRRALSRESDSILRERALVAELAILVSHWRLPGMVADSGTSTDWLLSHDVVNIRCICPPEIAAQRFSARKRHPGHCDGERSEADVLRSICDSAAIGPLHLGRVIDVETTDAPDLLQLLMQLNVRSG